MNLVIVKGDGGTALEVQKGSHYSRGVELHLLTGQGCKVFWFLALEILLPGSLSLCCICSIISKTDN